MRLPESVEEAKERMKLMTPSQRDVIFDFVARLRRAAQAAAAEQESKDGSCSL